MKRAITIAVFFFCILFLILSEKAYSQWRLVKHFSKPFTYFRGTSHQAASIRFVKFNEWGIGFAGTSPGPENPDGGLWRTIDSGVTWHLMKRNKHPGLEGLYCTDITFKDSLTGWIVTTYSEYTPSAGMIILQTTDGGSEWNVVYATGGAGGGAYGIYYAPYIDILLCSTWDAIGGAILASNDGGKTWEISVSSHELDGFTGNDSVIIAPGIRYPMVRSSDKGKTWHDVFMPNGEIVDCWQPYADNKRNLWYLAEQGDGNTPTPSSFYASTDLGESWKLMHKFDFFYYSDFDVNSFDNCKGAVNGAVSGDDSGYVYLQYINGGMIRSADTGKTWTSICGPSNKWDTRFTIFNNTIFAGDTNGIWALDLLTPQGIQITPLVSIPGSNCGYTRSPVYFTSTYYCSSSVVLDSISSGGSSAFTLLPNYRRGMISGMDSVFIDYVPQTSSDAGYVIFHFTENGIRRDTTVTIIGKIVSPHQDITLTPQLTINNLIAGKEAECKVFSSNRIQNRGLDKVTFDLTYDNDLLEAAEITAQAGMSATYTAPIVASGIARLPITIAGNNMTIDSLLPMVSVKFRTFLTDTTLSTIELSTIILNDDNPDYKNCTLSATGNSTTFTQASICGDSTIRSFMQTGKLINILSIRPNPTNADATVSFESFTNDKAHLQLLDELGKVVLEESLITKRGINEHAIAIPKHWSGTFYLRLQMGKDVVTGKLIVQ
jgi:hypothetical protein